MACHDGLTAVDSHGSAREENNGANKMTSSLNIDSVGNQKKRFIDDLSVTHPIGFLYSEAVEKRGDLKDVGNGVMAGELMPETAKFITGASSILTGSNFDTKNRTIAANGKLIKDTLYGGFMTCASCHEVHNTNNAVSDTGKTYNYFLLAREEGSAICLSCHIK
jgi:hypothetical protein